jgi:hypothetical protein
MSERKNKMRKKKIKLGRPPLPEGETGSVRSIRLNDERWEKLKILGRQWLEKALDRAKLSA